MRIVVLSVCDAPDVYLIRALRAAFEEVAVFRVAWERPPPPSRASLWSKVSLRKLYARIQSAAQVRRDQRIGRETTRLLFGVHRAPTVDDASPLAAHEVNEPETAERIRAVRPDVLVVSGAPILKPIIFNIPRLAALNVHYGVAPLYRGEHTLFWPLYLADYENIGVTLHHIDERIDGGRIVAVGYPALEKDDTEPQLMARCARLAAELLVDFLGSGEASSIIGRPQASRGRLFLRRHRTIWADAHYALRRLIGLATIPARVERQVRHFGDG